jgi:hypothetical protein
MSAGGAQTCFASMAGDVSCWGATRGDSPPDVSPAPTVVGGIDFVVEVLDSAVVVNCVLSPLGQVHCWGSAEYGGLGDGLNQDSYLEATSVAGITTAIALADSNGFHSCAVLLNGRIACWGGNNFNGELGDGTTDPATTPVLVQGIDDAVAACAGAAHTCAVHADGSVSC